MDPKRTPIWSIAGGKGGVGKSVLVALLCEALAKRELRVVALDLDLAGCNLHGLLGVPYPDKEPPRDHVSYSPPNQDQARPHAALAWQVLHTIRRQEHFFRRRLYHLQLTKWASVWDPTYLLRFNVWLSSIC